MERAGTIAANDILMRSIMQELLYFDRFYTTDNGLYEMRQMVRTIGSPGCPISDRGMAAKDVVVGRLLDHDILRVVSHSEVEELETEAERRIKWNAIRNLERGNAARESMAVLFDLDVQHRRRIAAFVHGKAAESRTMAVPLCATVDDLLREFRLNTAGGTPCLRVIMNALPALDESTPIDDVLAFRKDPEAVRLRRALLVWQSEIERDNLRPGEIEEILETKLSEYEEYMKLCRLRYQKKASGLIVRLAGGLIETILKRSPDPVLKRLFDFQLMKLDLREAELTAPGREVAYIAHSHQQFRSSVSHP